MGRLGESRNLNMGQLAVLARDRLGDLPKVEMGLAFQCRCGSTKWVRYQGRFYSPCGIRLDNPDVLTVKNRTQTFRQLFEASQ